MAGRIYGSLSFQRLAEVSSIAKGRTDIKTKKQLEIILVRSREEAQHRVGVVKALYEVQSSL